MESVSKANWSSFNGTVSVEESEIMAQLLSGYSFSNESDHNSSFFWSDLDVFPSYSSDNLNSSLYYLPLENAGNTLSSFFIPTSDHEDYSLSDPIAIPTINTSSEPTDFCDVDSSIQVAPTEHPLEVPACLIGEASSEEMGYSGTKLSDLNTPSNRDSSSKRKFQAPETCNLSSHDKENNEPECRRKKARASFEVDKNGKNAPTKKTPKSFGAEGCNAAITGQTSSSYSSEDDSNASQELNDGGASSSMKVASALNLNGKTRAGRGSATDPQSLYARKRRERINERLKVLQNLVPNGTKVDISTMLEEAVEYVKFLQLQIKLLSSDDLWMYAPIAYNGMDIGLDLKISPPQ